jgi:hypothetical protein
MNSNNERQYWCNRCAGDYVALRSVADNRNGLCGQCAEFYEHSKLARRTLRANGGRGDDAATNATMGYPSFGDAGHITYLVRGEDGDTIPMMTLCAAHDALFMWDAVGDGVSADDAAAHYTTQAPTGNCDTCNEFEFGAVEKRPRGGVHCRTCLCDKGGRS